MKAKLLYQKAISQWGYEAQLHMAVEECLELAHAIIKFIRDGRGDEYKRVEEEIADVEIMMAQMRLIFFTKNISRIKSKKLKRLQRRIEYANNPNK